MKHNQTTYVILGILAIHPHQSGYEIRKTIQQSVGFFWVSFGQIYPTLKRLNAEKLIVPSSSSGTSSDQPSGVFDHSCRTRPPSRIASYPLPRRPSPQ